MNAGMSRLDRLTFGGWIGLLVVAVAGVLAVLPGSGLAAQTCSIYWTGVTSPDWFTATNWSDSNGGASAGRLPGASDLVCMSSSPSTPSVTLGSGSAEVGGIEWAATSTVRPKLTLGGTLQVDSLADKSGSSTIDSVVLTGTLVALGPVLIPTLTLEGELDGPGAVTVPAGGVLTLGGSAPPVLMAGADLVNDGTATQAATQGVLDLNGGSTAENGGSLTLAAGEGISDQNSSDPSRFVNDAAGSVTSPASIAVAVINRGTISLDAASIGAVGGLANDGTLTVSGGTVTAGGSSTSSTDAGTLDPSGGDLQLAGAWSLAKGASTSSSSDGALKITGTTTAVGSNTLGNVDVSGTLIAKGTMTIPNLSLSGEVDGPGTVTVASSLSVSDAGTLTAEAHLANGGSASVTGMNLYGGSEFENSGSLDLVQPIEHSRQRHRAAQRSGQRQNRDDYQPER